MWHSSLRHKWVYIRPTTGPYLGKVATDAHLKTSYSRLLGYKMFVAVLAATLFMLSAATGGSAADFCTTSLTPLVGGGGECSASGGGDLLNEVRQNVSTLLPGVVRCMLQLGRTPEYPANSCAELAEREPDIPSGNYWILNSTQSPVQVFCEMGDVFPPSLNVTGGWVRVANLNMTDPDQQCPENLQLSYTDQPIRLCGRRTDRGCDSVTFTTGVQYQQVCGRVRGYQFGSPDAFIYCPAPCTTDDPYVDGVSITHGASPRKHIWTYAAGVFEYSTIVNNCPCNGGSSPPSFVDSDYYCESGLSAGNWFPTVLYPNDPLWDGQDCNGLERTCCDPPNLPWFCKELPQSTTDDLEFRICGDQSLADEDTPIDLVQLYIQ